MRVILDSPSAGAWNMAVDQALLESVEWSGVPTLRMYAWEPATLSLGYFQSYSDCDKYLPTATCPVVRRASGGGAILHHLETTYCLCVPSRHRWSARNTELYTTVHDCIIESLAEWDVVVAAYEQSKHPQQPSRAASDKAAFLCFLRRSSGDLILQDHKVVGSAQRRSKSGLLQHGSILWERSVITPELPGINDLAEQCVDQVQFVESFVSRLARKLELPMRRYEITDDERKLARQIMQSKFGTDAWNRNRNRNRTLAEN